MSLSLQKIKMENIGQCISLVNINNYEMVVKFVIAFLQHMLMTFIASSKNLVNIFKTFYKFPGLKPKISKCEASTIDLLKGTIYYVCDLKLFDLTCVEMDVHFSYNNEAQWYGSFVQNHQMFPRLTQAFILWRRTLVESFP